MTARAAAIAACFGLASSAAAVDAPSQPPAAAPAPGSEAPATGLPAAPLPPVRAGRTVIVDTQAVLGMQAGQLTLRDLDAEAADVIAEINRAPSTWQSYLLATQEDLPDKLFHPGFTFVLDRPEKRREPRVATGPARPADDAQQAPPAPARPPGN